MAFILRIDQSLELPASNDDEDVRHEFMTAQPFDKIRAISDETIVLIEKIHTTFNNIQDAIEETDTEKKRTLLKNSREKLEEDCSKMAKFMVIFKKLCENCYIKVDEGLSISPLQNDKDEIKTEATLFENCHRELLKLIECIRNKIELNIEKARNYLLDISVDIKQNKQYMDFIWDH